jgi:DNA-binding MarR family transcriptional regulator
MTGETLNFSLNEKKTLSGLCQYPMFSDSKIADKIGINHSTFATVKKRLRQNDLFRRYRLPNLTALGVEILSVLIRNFRKKPSKGDSDDLSKKYSSLNTPNILLSFIETNFSLFTVVHQNFTKLGEFLWKYDRFAHVNHLVDTESKFELNFPLLFSVIPRFLDFSRSLSNHLGVKQSPTPFRSVFSTIDFSEMKITKLGWKIFLAFLEYPEYTSKQIAQLVDKPRTTVSRWLRIFTKANLISPIIVPNLQKLGYSLFLIGNLAVRSSSHRTFSRVLSLCDDSILPIVLMQTDHDIFYISPFSSLESAQNAEFEFIQKMNNAEIGFRRVFRFNLSIPLSIFNVQLDSGFLEFTQNIGRPTI